MILQYLSGSDFQLIDLPRWQESTSINTTQMILKFCIFKHVYHLWPFFGSSGESIQLQSWRLTSTHMIESKSLCTQVEDLVFEQQFTMFCQIINNLVCKRTFGHCIKRLFMHCWNSFRDAPSTAAWDRPDTNLKAQTHGSCRSPMDQDPSSAEVCSSNSYIILATRNSRRKERVL